MDIWPGRGLLTDRAHRFPIGGNDLHWKTQGRVQVTRLSDGNHLTSWGVAIVRRVRGNSRHLCAVVPVDIFEWG